VGKYDAVYLVANGGTKLSPVGLLSAFAPTAPRRLYGDERPAVYSVYPAGLGGAPEVRPYTRHELDLPDILRVNGCTFATCGRAIKIWPAALPGRVADERYGADENYTMGLHCEVHARFNAPVAGERVPFATLAATVPDAYQKWQRTIEAAHRARLLNDDRLRDVYSATLNLDNVARRAAGAATGPPAIPAGDGIGASFERAVARRARAWVERTRHTAVQSVWTDVIVARDRTPHEQDVQFDVLLVLTNGVLIHLECKSAEVDVPDLDRRAFRLKEAGSQLARLVVVLPLYASRADEPWAARLQAARSAIEARHLTVLPFTWAGDPVEGPTFETELERLLAPYGRAGHP